jgi:ABC-type glutathione transport system ATPase component
MASNLTGQESGSSALLRVRALCKRYQRGRFWKRLPVAAVHDVHFEIPAGKTLALVGVSGSGKSTVARCVARLESPDSGQIWFDGTDVARLRSRDLLPFRSSIQMIFQDAATAMNPRFSAAEIIEEPLRIQGEREPERRERCAALMKEVALSPDYLNRRAMEFSGGQRQRLVIARALTLRPKLVILDESLSGLDLSTQAQIANLLLDLQAAHGLAYLLISHDLTLVARMADVTAVMFEGRIVETETTQQIVADPRHPETKKLLQVARSAELKLALSAGATR